MRRLKTVEQLRPIDDVLFHAMYQDQNACTELLRTIFADNDLVLMEPPRMQHEIINLNGRSVRLDALCKMGNGSLCNVEVQRANNDDHYRRIRYNASCITASNTPKRADFVDIQNVYIVYLTEFDLAKTGHTLSHIDSMLRENQHTIDDGLYRMLVTTAIRDGTKLARLMENFSKTDFNDPEFPASSERIHHYKHTEEGVQYMCDIVQKYADSQTNRSNAVQFVNMIEAIMQNSHIDAKAACKLTNRDYNDYVKAKQILSVPQEDVD